MIEYFALFFSSLSAIIMLIMFVKFKKLFSTDSIIEKTRAKMNQFITDMNRNANSVIELVNESTRRLRALLKDADEKMAEYNEATQRLRKMIAETEKIKTKKILIENSARDDINSKKKSYEKPKSRTNPYAKDYISPDSSYEIKSDDLQGSLFDENDVILKDETKVTADGAAYKEVPLLVAKVYDENIDGTKNANNFLNENVAKMEEKVAKLFANGMNAEEIAMELSCSASEVQFIIDMQISQS